MVARMTMWMVKKTCERILNLVASTLIPIRVPVVTVTVLLIVAALNLNPIPILVVQNHHVKGQLDLAWRLVAGFL